MVDLSRLVANVTHFPVPAPRPRAARDPERRLLYAFRLVIGEGQAVWLGSEEVVRERLPPGGVWIDALLAKGGLPTVRRTPGFTTGTATVGGGSYKFLDDRGELGAWLANKTANGRQLFSRYIEQYVFYDDLSLADPEVLDAALLYTFQVRGSISLDHAVYEIATSDIARDIDRDVFVERAWRLLGSIDAENQSIPIGVPDGSEPTGALFEHAADYTVHPGETCGIALLEDGDGAEYFSYTGVGDAGGVVVTGADGNTIDTIYANVLERGLFGTEPRAWLVDADTPIENRPKITLIPYAEEDPMSLAHAMLVDETLDGRAWPWGVGLDPRWVNSASFAAATSERRRTLKGAKKIKAKKWIEEEILRFMPGVLLPNPAGELEFVPEQFTLGTAPAAVLDDTTSYLKDFGNLVHDAKNVAYPIEIEWDWHPLEERYRQITQWIDETAALESGATEPKTYSSKLITTTRSTESEIQQLSAVLHARHARPVKRLSGQPAQSLWHLPVGSIVQVRQRIPDYADFDDQYRDLDAPMQIGSISHNQNANTLSWDLIGYREPVRPGSRGAAEPLELAAYVVGGTALSSVSGVSISNGIASGSPLLRAGVKYYHIGDLTLGPSFVPRFTNEDHASIRLWVQGVLIIACRIDLSGRGASGGRATATNRSVAGYAGYVPAGAPGGSVFSQVRRFTNSSGAPQGITGRRLRSRPPPELPRPARSALPDAPTVQAGRLVGAPASLVGAGGAAGSTSESIGRDDQGDAVPGDTRTVAGGNGGIGGGGLEIVARPGSGFGGSGQVIVSGNDAAAAAYDSVAGIYGGAGAGGAHGFLYWLVDGNGTKPLIDGSRLIAINGRSNVAGNRLASASETTRSNIGTWRSFYEPSADDGANRWRAAHAVAVIPPTQNVGDSVYSSLTAQFFEETQPDGQVRLYVSDVDPSDGNPFDLVISQVQLDTGGAQPVFRYLHPTEGWRAFDWVNDPYVKYAHVFATVIAMNRRFGGLVFHYGAERPQVFNDGDAWLSSTSGITWILRTSGQDERWLEDGAETGDERNSDPNFSLTAATLDAQGWKYYYPTNDAGAKPRQTRAGSGGSAGGGSYPAGTGLEPPINVAALVFSDTAGALQWNHPFTRGAGTQYGIFLDGARIATQTSTYHDLTGLPPGTANRVGVRSENGAQSETSDVVEKILQTTGAGGGGGGTGGGTDGGGGDPGVPAPTGLSFTAYGPTNGELLWGTVADPTRIQGYEVKRDGTVIGTAQGGSFYMDDLAAGTTYAFAVASIDGNARSSAITVSGTTQAGSGGGGGGGAGGSASGLGVESDGPQVRVTGGSQFEGRGLFMEFRDSGNAVVHSTTVNFAGGVVTYTPPSPSSYAAWTGFVIDTNGDGHSLPGQPRTYSS